MDCKTPIESIKNSVNKIENMLKKHDKIDKNLIIVSFNELQLMVLEFLYISTQMNLNI